MNPYDELFTLAERLKNAADGIDASGIAQPLTALEEAANAVDRSFSGSRKV